MSNQNRGVAVHPVTDVWGYWTLSSIADDSGAAWYVDHDGDVFSYYDIGIWEDDFGVRPVITVQL